jgi:hypothetical protein
MGHPVDACGLGHDENASAPTTAGATPALSVFICVHPWLISLSSRAAGVADTVGLSKQWWPSHPRQSIVNDMFRYPRTYAIADRTD